MNCFEVKARNYLFKVRVSDMVNLIVILITIESDYESTFLKNKGLGK